VQTVCISSRWCHCHPKTPSSLASFKSRLVLRFWYQLTQIVLEKTPLNRCSNSTPVICTQWWRNAMSTDNVCLHLFQDFSLCFSGWCISARATTWSEPCLGQVLLLIDDRKLKYVQKKISDQRLKWDEKFRILRALYESYTNVKIHQPCLVSRNKKNRISVNRLK